MPAPLIPVLLYGELAPPYELNHTVGYYALVY